MPDRMTGTTRNASHYDRGRVAVMTVLWPHCSAFGALATEGVPMRMTQRQMLAAATAAAMGGAVAKSSGHPADDTV
jgi:hypothetical protein